MAATNDELPGDTPTPPQGEPAAAPGADAPHEREAGEAETAALLGAIAGLALESAARIAAAALHGLADGITAAAEREAKSKAAAPAREDDRDDGDEDTAPSESPPPDATDGPPPSS